MNQSSTCKKITLCLALLLIAAVLLPTAIKFAHVFQDHKHELCEDFTKTHLHNLDLDCEFYKFKVSAQFHFKAAPNVLILSEANYQSIEIKREAFYIEDAFLSYGLRAPPVLV